MSKKPKGKKEKGKVPEKRTMPSPVTHVAQKEPKSGSTFLRCSNTDCTSEYQDKMYGRKLRLHTVGNTQKRCTVCGKDNSQGR